MKQSSDLVVFTLDEQLYAIRLPVVERVVRAVAVTALPKAPVIVLGVINVQGALLPVVNLRLRLGLAPRSIDTDDQFLIARTARRRVVLVVDSIAGVFEVAQANIIATGLIAPGLSTLEAVAKLGTDLLFIYDLEMFLSFEEETILEDALEAARV
jgi:purine-binding chemotaxis protein CheW